MTTDLARSLRDATRGMVTTRPRLTDATWGDSHDSSAQSPHKEEEPSEPSGNNSRMRGGEFIATGHPPPPGGPPEEDDAPTDDVNFTVEFSVYFVGVSFAFVLPYLYHRLWPTHLGYQLVVYASIAYDLIKIFYSVPVQDWLNRLDAGTIRNRNPLLQWMHRMMADNTDFYGPNVGQNTKWSKAISLFYINSVIGHVVRSGWCVVRCGHDEVAMERLRDFVCTHQFFHMGICRAQSMLYINQDETAGRPRVALLNQRRARHAQTLSISIVTSALCVKWLLDYAMPSFNLVVKFLVDNCWYCMRFFIVDDPMFHILGRRGQDSALVETCALMHLLESMFADFVMTVSVAFTPTMLDAWTQADFCVQAISMVILGYVSHNKSQPLRLDREGLAAKHLLDVFLKIAVIVSHSFTWLPS